MLKDVRFAFRTLVKNPAFTLAAVVCLALGIGVNTAIFSCVQALLLRPFPYRNPDELLALRENNLKRGWRMNSVSYPNFHDWREQSRTLESAGMYGGASFNLASGTDAEYVRGATVSATMFHVLGIPPQLGRDFREEEDRVGAPKVAIISDRLWTDRFDRRRDVIGQQIRLNGEPYQIIGVMPPKFEFPQVAQIWTTLGMDPKANRGNHSWEVIGRAKPGTTVERVRADLNAIAKQLGELYPNSNTGWGVDVETIREEETGDIKPVLAIMMASVGLVLLIACANVANLLLARAAERSKEMAVRAALGASRWRVVRQLLTESVMVALIGAALGVGFGYGFLKWIVSNIETGMPFWMNFTIDGPVLAFTTAVALGTGLLFGLAPALQSARPNLNETLRDAGARGSSAGRSRQRVRSALVVAEVALSLILLVGATLMIRSFVSLQSVQPGFDPGNVLTMRLFLGGANYDSLQQRTVFFDQLLARVRALPGVTSAGIINNLPLGGSNNNSSIVVEGQIPKLGDEPIFEVRWAGPGYLESMKIPLRSGRFFTEQEARDTAPAARVAVINEYMAKKFWPNEDPVGKRFKFGNASDTLNRWVQVIGVAGDIRHKRLSAPPDLQGYMPYARGGWRNMTLVVRTSGDPARATGQVREAIRAVDPALPAYNVYTMDDVARRSTWQQRLYGKMFGAFAVIALVLAAVGVYGVISYAVTQRTQEIGVRVALGAQRGDVLRLIVGHGLLLGGAGAAIGLLGAAAATKALKSLLFGVGPWDPATFAGITALLLGVALLASVIPALRAAKVDPVEALRYE
ncbi:MAG TPA: ABC transporter permease [Gemmatimonadaceae bacterium]|nr:ABC transporter permease [Gemmatimonadaceae bacterium]